MPAAPVTILQRQDHSTVEAGRRLRRERERLNLKFRDVEQLSLAIAERHSNPEFTILLSRLSDIETQGTVPSIYKLYSLCCIYRLDLNEVLGWYGVPVQSLPADAGLIRIGSTHPVSFNPDSGAEAMLPLSLDPGVDLSSTFFLNHVVEKWGKLPLALIGAGEVRRFRYAFIGTEDRSMSPTLPPGSLLVVDDTRRKIQTSGWKSLAERPIYFLEHRDRWYCRWCSLSDGIVSLIPDPSSDSPVEQFRLDAEIEVVGQVVGVATSLDLSKGFPARS